MRSSSGEAIATVGMPSAENLFALSLTQSCLALYRGIGLARRNRAGDEL
jgi:hypothetical protein